uniref:Zgc:113210 n=1 Tax=Bursaphelenchus xylophilus TaxID=6326 RepID=A0A1I7SFG6_BURXY
MEIACKYGGAGSEQSPMEIDDFEDPIDDDPLDEDENNRINLSLSYNVTVSSAICEALAPYIKQMKFGRDKETARLWDVVVQKVADQFPHLSEEQKSKRRIRSLFKDIRKRALQRKADGKPLTEHQEIACMYGGGGTEKNQPEFDMEDPLEDEPLEEGEIRCNSPKPKKLKVSSDLLRHFGSSESPVTSNVKDEDLEEDPENGLDDAPSRMGSAEAAGRWGREDSEENEDDLGSFSSFEPEFRDDTASPNETVSIIQSLTVFSLFQRDRMVLRALGHRLDEQHLRIPCEDRQDLPKSPAYNNTWTAAICEAMEPFVTKMKCGKDEETDRLWGLIAQKVAKQFPELQAEKKLKRRLQTIFRNFRTRALARKALGRALTDHQEIACLYGGEGAEKTQLEFAAEDDPMEEDEQGQTRSHSCPRRPSEARQTSPKSHEFMPSLSTAVCEAIEPYVAKMKFGRDKETDRLWDVVLKKVAEKFPNISMTYQSKRRIRSLFHNIRIRAIGKRARGQPLTVHQEIACRYGAEVGEQNQMELDLEDPMDDSLLDEAEMSSNNTHETEIIKVSTDNRYHGPSKAPLIYIVKKKNQPKSRLDSDASDRSQITLNSLVESAKAPAEPAGMLAGKEGEKRQDEPGPSSSLEPECRTDTASLTEANSSQSAKSLPLSQWLKIVDFCQRANQDFYLEGNHLVFTDRSRREKVLRIPMDRVCLE